MLFSSITFLFFFPATGAFDLQSSAIRSEEFMFMYDILSFLCMGRAGRALPYAGAGCICLYSDRNSRQ